jgi:DNA mismatch repair protein MutS
MSSTNDNSIIIDYFKITKEYQTRYGEKIILLMQVGAFFEVYGLKNPFTNKNEITQIDFFSETCNMVIAEKSFALGNESVKNIQYPEFPLITPSMTASMVTKKIQEWKQQIPKSKVVMAGHSVVKLENYIQKITDAGYTAVVYVQEKDSNDRVIERKLQGIYSPGTFLGNTEHTQQLTNNIMCIWMEKIRSTITNTDTFLCGISNINVFTGESTLFEYNIPFYMNPTTFDELERNITTHKPNEIIIISDFSQEFVSTILKYIGVSNSVMVHKVSTENEKSMNCTKQTYIHQILSNFFGTDTFHTCSEFQSNILATQSLCYLLNFVQEHNPDLVRNIRLPQFINTSQRMILANHTLKQLNILSDDSNDSKMANQLSSVSTFLNRCCTSMGKRKFQFQITNPTFNEDELNLEYTMIDLIQTKMTQSKIIDIRKTLHTMRDMEKMCRQIISNKLLPSSIVHLYNTVQSLSKIHKNEIVQYNELYTYFVGESDDLQPIMDNFLEFLDQRFFLELCASVNSQTYFEENIIRPNMYTDLDECIKTKLRSENLLDDLLKGMNQWIKNTCSVKDDCIKIHDTEKSGKSYQITKKRGIAFKKALDNKQISNLITISSQGESYVIKSNDIQFINASSNYDRIMFPLLNETTQLLLSLDGKTNEMLTKVYATIVQEIESSWYDLLEKFSKYISKIDVLLNKVYIANEYHYCRPQIMDTSNVVDAEKSMVQATGLRHCLIEHLQTQEIYVTNDITLGNGEEDGILLYGTNAVGKTSIIRALGIAIILAQSGCYVPCTKFIYKPYTAIFSRILGNDNIFKGLSTFAVEMSELRIILKMADQNSLILGDELCSGTEIESALSIFMSGLVHLHEKNASFIFATHFHDILNFTEMTNLSRLHIKHMSVIYNRELDCLVYDRLLKNGPGNRMYGLEVCKSLHLPEEFLERAYEIRNKYYSEINSTLTHVTSHYNSHKIIGICEICNLKMGNEIHHIQYQQWADSTGFVKHHHKNHEANLISICTKCHDTIHANDRNHKSTEKMDDRVETLSKKKTTKGYKLIR